MDKFFTFTGNIRKDHFGRIVVDTCPSDPSHLVDGVTDPVERRALCRKLIDDAFSDFLGKSGTLVLTISLREDQAALPVAEMSDQTTRQVLDAGAAEKKPALSRSQLELSVLAAVEHVDG